MYPSLIYDIDGNDREGRAFHFFRSHILLELARVIRTPWYRLLLQACLVNKNLADAAIALGSLGERFQVNPVLTTGVQYADECHAFARRHYQAAISRIRHQLSSNEPQTIYVVLLCCFLFISFEFMQGNDQVVLIHLRNGLNIIKSTWPTAPAEIDVAQLSTIPEGAIQLRGCILHIFTILDVQAAVWLSLRSFQLNQMLVPLVGTSSGVNALGPFRHLDDADTSLTIQINEPYRFRRTVSAIDRPGSLQNPSQLPQGAVGDREKLIAQLSQWRTAFNLLLESLTTQIPGINHRSPYNVYTGHRISLMTVHHDITTLAAALTLQSPQAEDRLCRQSECTIFQKILAAAESLIQPVNIMLTPEMRPYIKTPPSDLIQPLFHFLPGLIQPLYFTAVKSRNPRTQQRAIALLGTKPWREGAWDSAAMAAIASRHVADGVGSSL
jgi:Fungal specific transcription factor domain